MVDAIHPRVRSLLKFGEAHGAARRGAGGHLRKEGQLAVYTDSTVQRHKGDCRHHL